MRPEPFRAEWPLAGNAGDVTTWLWRLHYVRRTLSCRLLAGAAPAAEAAGYVHQAGSKPAGRDQRTTRRRVQPRSRGFVTVARSFTGGPAGGCPHAPYYPA
ncbi:MAG: hypothetical protein M1118_15405 [Chloroflexi bacterium]|nr:hypothetical protein [Chloroflexota bacterium]